MVGLPHLAVGALLRRARELQQPVLVSANALSRWSRKRGWREWAGWTTRPLATARSLHSLSLDSAGFSAMVTYGSYPWTVDDYVRLDRKSVVWGKRVSVRVDLGGRVIIKK